MPWGASRQVRQTAPRLSLQRTWQRMNVAEAAAQALRGGREQPIRRPLTESRFDRIVLDILDDTAELLLIEHTMIERFILPESARAAKQPIAFPGGAQLQRVHDPFARRALLRSRLQCIDPDIARLKDPMKMAGHD